MYSEWIQTSKIIYVLIELDTRREYDIPLLIGRKKKALRHHQDVPGIVSWAAQNWGSTSSPSAKLRPREVTSWVSSGQSQLQWSSPCCATSQASWCQECCKCDLCGSSRRSRQISVQGDLVEDTRLATASIDNDRLHPFSSVQNLLLLVLAASAQYK